MNVTLVKKVLSAILCATLITLTTPIDAAAFQSQTPAPATTDYSGQGAAQTADELQALVAPIALYPDALVAQILSGSTFPDQIAVADNWLQTNKALTGNALAQAVDKQTWDPSVKALTQFPDVLNKMAQSLAWTSSLGEAYHNQQADVMAAVQTLRAQAQKAGNLKSGSQITVVQQTPQTIVIQPTNPQIVYVPEYNPAIIYGYPYVTPGYSTGALIATGVLAFGAGLAIGSMMSGGYGWGWSSWNCNWHGGAVYYHGGAYYGNSAWHGGYYGGGYNYNNSYHNNNYNNYNHSNYNNSGHNYNNSGHNTNISGNTVNVNRSAASSSSFGDKSGGWDSAASSHGFGQSGAGRGSTAFSGASSGGWQSRTSSARGWGSSGGGGGWGGRSSGGFGGGGFSRGGGGFGGRR